MTINCIMVNFDFKDNICITAHSWCGGHFTNISACRVKIGVQVSKRELYTHIHLDYVRIEILSCILKKTYFKVKNL